MRQRIDFLAPPFAGHLHPILGMAKAASKHYDVRVVSTRKAQADIQAAGLKGLILSNVDDKLLMTIINAPKAIGSNPFKLNKQFSQVLDLLVMVKSELEVIYEDNLPDLFIIDFTLPVGGFFADEKKTPWWTSLASPCVLESPTGPPSYLGGLKPRSDFIGKCRDKIGYHLIRTFKRTVCLLHRRRIKKIGFTRLYRDDKTEAVYSPHKILCPALREIEFERQWPDAVDFVGPFLFSPQTQSNSHVNYDSDKSYVLISLGTHSQWIKEEVVTQCERLSENHPDFIFHFTDGSIQNSKLIITDNFERYGYINYADNMHHYSYVIHHGGIGIMNHCLYHGIPSLVFPIDYDQFDYAARLEVAGLSLWLNDINKLPEYFTTLLRNKNEQLNCIRFSNSIKENPSDSLLLQRLLEYFSSLVQH